MRNSDQSDAGAVHHRKLLLVGVSVLVAAVVIGLAGRPLWQDRTADEPHEVTVDDSPATPSVSASQPACGPIRQEAVDASKHVDDGSIDYDAAPPSFGDHRSWWDYYAGNFYQIEDRPAVAVLVHNLEHGYNILWYDAAVADDSAALAQVQELAENYSGARRDPDTALIAAPWTSADGGPFPGGMHYALTHWYADADDPTGSRADEIGYTRYCRALSASAVERWMQDYPLEDAPEGFPENM